MTGPASAISRRGSLHGAYAAAVTTTSGRLRVALLTAGLCLGTGLGGCSLTGGEKSAFCQLLEDAYPAYRTEPSKALGPDAGASEWKAYFDVTHQRNQRLLAAAPGELTAALTDIQTTNDQLAAFYAEAEYHPTQVDSGALAQLFDDTGYRSAVSSVTGYAKDTCDIDTGSPPTLTSN